MTDWSLRFRSFSYGFAGRVLKGRLALKREVEEIFSEEVRKSAPFHGPDSTGCWTNIPRRKCGRDSLLFSVRLGSPVPRWTS